MKTNEITWVCNKMKACKSSHLNCIDFTKRIFFISISLILITLIFPQDLFSQASASNNYAVQTGNLGTTYSWINCSAGTSIVTGDDTQASVTWPFNFSFYNNNYTTANSLSVATNGFIRLDGVAAGGNYSASNSYDLTSSATTFGQIISLSMYDCYVGRTATSWVKYLVTGTAPYRVLTIEYNNIEIPYYAGVYANVQVSFYETLNKVVLKLGTDNISTSGADMGIHSGVAGYFHKWQEVQSGTNNTWIEYTPQIKVTSTAGTTLAYYSTLKAAFDKINNGTHQGTISVLIQESTTETAAAVLNASGTGSANYVAVNIYPTASGKSITGNLATPLIDLNGADNVTIDGRVNATGNTKDLTITNTSTSSVAGISTIRFLNDASNNNLKYCNIKGSETRATSGVVYFSTTTGATGNDNNIIENNDITNSADANRPVNAIYSAGTSGKENSQITILNNNIFNFLKHATASNGIFVSDNSTAWTIVGNSFYETTSFIPSGTVTYNAIKIENNIGDNFTITDNYIGGSSAQCGGSAWTKTNTASNVFNAIYILVGTNIASSLQNNTVKNFIWSNSANSNWTGLNIAGGNVNIGNITANTIGSATGTGTITVTGATSGQSVYGMYISSLGTVVCENNIIGSITGTNAATNATNIYGIYQTGAGTINIEHNAIGSTTTASSINSSSASTGNAQTLYGIYASGVGVATIDNNTITNLTNSTTNTTVGTVGLIRGIITVSGTNIITNNTISNLSIANANTNTAPAVGISSVGTTESQTISGNTIYNISNTYASFAGAVMGIYLTNNLGSTASTLNANFIYNITVSATSTGARIYGIFEDADAITCSNNILNLGGNTASTIYGIYDVGTANKVCNLYFNTIYISGTNAGTQNSYAVWSQSNTNTRNIRNNIFYNARTRTGGSGYHYAIFYNATGTALLTADYNDYYVSGTGGILGYYGGNIAALPIVTAQDVNSLSTNPIFTNAGGTAVSDYYPSASLTGVFGTGITTGFFGITRYNPPKMGALESNDYVWQGNTSSDFATASNWANGAVPPNGADIVFAANPSNHCVLDQNRTIHNVVNAQSTDQLVINGKQLTITGDLTLSNGAQINANSASSVVIFEGTEIQTIPSGAFVSNTIDALTLNNAHGLSQNGNLTISTSISLTLGQYNIGNNTLTINGTIISDAGTLLGGESTNIVIGGSGATTTIPAIDLNNLTLNRVAGISVSGNIHVHSLLTLTSGTLDIGTANLLICGSSPIRTSGNINASNAASTITFDNASAITLPNSLFTGAINNMTISGTGGITSVDNLTINGILSIPAANPSATKGALDMIDGTTLKTLTMAATSSTTGIGDVTGIIKRTSIVAGVIYTYGNEHTTVYFTSDGILPSEMSAKITIGTTPSWMTGAINREIEIIQTGGSGTKAMFSCHYLDTELNGNIESRLSFWTKYLGLEYGRSGQNSDENWVSLSNCNVAFFPASFDDAKNLTLDEFSPVNTITWNGSVSDSWTSVENWTPNSGPSAAKNVIIPDASTTPFSPTIPAITEVKTLTIEANGVVNSVASAQITINGGNGAWINNGGTLNANTSQVIFTNASATISGSTNFYDVKINTGATLMLLYGSTMRIAGTITNDGTWRTVIAGNSTVEYNGGDQTVIIPNVATNRYYNLILSGSGVKTLPNTNLNIIGNFSILNGVTTTAAAELSIGGNLQIGTGSTFTTGAYDHAIAGNFDNNGTFTSGAGKTITLNGSSLQSIMGSSTSTFEKLTINNPNGVTLYQNIVVNNILSLTAGDLNVGATTLTINGDIVQTSGHLSVDSLSSLIFGGTTALNTTGLFASDPVLNNLTVNRTGGLTFGENLCVHGILNLQTANPSSTVGSLTMGSHTLSMYDNATTIGIGDVTGIVKRNYFVPNVEYTFGNQYTTISFNDGGVYPSEIKCKISIGTAPAWKSSSIQRLYDFIQTGGANCIANISTHYLDSELNGNSESQLSQWTNGADGQLPAGPFDWGVSNYNPSENWVLISNVNIEFFPTSFTKLENTLSNTEQENYTWNGSVNTLWATAENWTPTGIPTTTSNVTIPDASLTANDPVFSANIEIKKILIHENGILNASGSPILTVNGSSGAWHSMGTFNAATSTVIFTNVAATMADPTNFYNMTIANGATLTLENGNIARIAGCLTLDGSAILVAAFQPNTIEFNGTGDQTIINPNGPTPGYYNLIISGSGTKTLPNTNLNILGDFSVEGTALVNPASEISILGDMTIESGATFTTGSFDHTLSGNFENNGTFTASASEVFHFESEVSQTISGSSTTIFEKLDIHNLEGLTLSSPITINDNLNLCHGNFTIGNTTLSVNGTITKDAGYLSVSSVSSLNFGGSDALTLVDYLFSNTPTINNLTINRSGGISLGNQSLTINGALTLTSGTLSLAANNVTIAGSSLVRTSGNIDASNSSAGLIFANSSALTLPASIFNGNINNLSITGVGGITASDNIAINGVLNLEAVNPSSTKGILDMGINTLSMAVNASTTGIGDVTGIVKRQHTFTDGVEYSFGNQFTTLNFIDISGSTKPEWISCKIELGTAPIWRDTNVKRIYRFAQETAGNGRVIAKLHYLNSEINASETDESRFTIWNDFDGLVAGDNTYVIGKNNNEVTNNYVEIFGISTNYLAPSTSFAKQYGLGYTNVSTITWTGLGSASYPGDWSLPGHWSGGVPTANDDVLIPADLPDESCGYPDVDLLVLFHDAEVKSIEIEPGASLEASNFDITVYGDGLAWVNNGGFYANNHTVTFANGDPSKTVSISGDNQFNNLVITDKTTLKPTSGSTNIINGNLNCDGTFSSTNENTIIFSSGNANQTISGVGQYNFYNLTMGNTFATGALRLQTPISISNVLSLSNNNIVTDDANFILMGTSSTVSPEGGSEFSFVDGPMRKSGNTAFIFPIGAGTVWAPIGIAAPASPSTIAATYTFASSANNWDPNYMCDPDEIHHTSGVEYWNLTTTDATPAVTLYWKDAARSGIENPNDLVVAHWENCPAKSEDNWLSKGGTIVEDGATTGHITSTISFDSYSPITIATKKNNNPLPVELIEFEGRCVNNEMLLTWTTASEINNNYFAIEWSDDAKNWNEIGLVTGVGNSNQTKNYSFTDVNANKTNYYYRLKQVDFDGKSDYSNIIKIEACNGLTSEFLTVFPNPSDGNININSSSEILEIRLCDLSGKVIYQKNKINAESTECDFSKLKKGMYIIEILTINKTFNQRITIM